MLETHQPRTWCAVLMVCACAIISNASASDEATTSTDAEESSWQQPQPGRVNIVTAGFAIERILAKFQEYGVKVRARGNVPGTKVAGFIARNMSAHDALLQLVNTEPDWLLYEPSEQPGSYEIWDQESFREQVLPTQAKFKVFQLKNIPADEATKELYGNLTPKVGKATYDLRTNKMFITDLPPALEMFQRMLEQIDVDFITRVFYIAHGDVDSIADKLSRMKSASAPRPESDERTRQIIVRDRLENIRRMEMLVQTLDIEARAPAKDTPLGTWRVTAADNESATILDEAHRDRKGRLTPMTLREGHPEIIKLNNTDSTVTLLSVTDAKSTTTATLATFRVERGPTEVSLKITAP